MVVGILTQCIDIVVAVENIADCTLNRELKIHKKGTLFKITSHGSQLATLGKIRWQVETLSSESERTPYDALYYPLLFSDNYVNCNHLF